MGVESAWGPCPGLPGHGLVTGSAWATKCQGMPMRPPQSRQVSSEELWLSLAPASISGTRGLWPHLAVCPGRPRRPRTSRLRSIRGTLRSFFSCSIPPPPRSHHDPMGSTSGAGGGNTDTQRALGPLGGSLCSPAPDFPVPPHLAALPASPGPQASRGGGAETAARGRGRDVPEPQPVGTEGPWCCRGPGGSGCAGEAGPAHQGGGTVSRAQSVLHRETRTRRGGKRLRLCLERV